MAFISTSILPSTELHTCDHQMVQREYCDYLGLNDQKKFTEITLEYMCTIKKPTLVDEVHIHAPPNGWRITQKTVYN